MLLTIAVVLLAITLQLFSWWVTGSFHERTLLGPDSERLKWMIWWIVSYGVRSTVLTVVLFASGQYDYIGWIWIFMLVVKYIYIKDVHESQLVGTKLGRIFLMVHAIKITRLGGWK